jgi:hypothetical protein
MKVHFSIMPFLCITACFCSIISHAQVSVLATEGTSGPTPYTSLKTAFDAINSGTHKAAITLTISANIAESETAVLKASGTGGSTYSSIVIKPASASSPVISGDVANSLIVLEGTTNVTIDGSNSDAGNTKDLTIINSSLSGSAVILINGASGNILKNTSLKSAVANSGVLVFSTSVAATGNDNNRIENNDITRASTGLPLMGIQNVGSSGKPNTGNVFFGNRIFDFYSFGFSDGDEDGDIGFSTNTLLEGNEFFSTEALAPNLIGIFINNGIGVSGMTISKNRIHSLNVNGSGEGIKGILLYDAVSVTVVNNMISLSDSKAEIMGISQETGGAVIKILHNSILIYGTGDGSTRSFALFKNWFSTGDDIRNNQIINTRVSAGTARQYAFIQFGPGTFTADYNNLVSTGNASNFIGGASSTTTPTLYDTFKEWQTGTSQDVNSININPGFVSSTDLHLITSENKSIDNKGTPIMDISTDIDGDPRSADSPDIGADEFTSTGPDEPVITSISIPDINVASAFMYPNPVANKIMLHVEAKIPMIVNWKAFDMNGRMVTEFNTPLNIGKNEIHLDLGNLPAGSYYLGGDTTKGKLVPIRFIKF